MIEAKALTKTFGSLRALDAVNFSIGEGSVFGLVGSNGAGKSTFLRLLAGVYMPDGGELFVDRAQPFENSEVKSSVFFISDYPYFFPQANLTEMAQFYRKLYPNWNEDKYRELMKLFPISATDRIANMSKGMQRQAAIICAVSTTPKYLLMDEIFDGLDPVMRKLLKRVINGEVSDRGMTVVIASHNLRELEDVCDHIGLMHKGGILLDQEIDALKLGVSKVQAVFRPMITLNELAGLNIIQAEELGSMLNLVVRNSREEALEIINRKNPIFAEALPLTLEEVFISEMEAAGYDLDKILS